MEYLSICWSGVQHWENMAQLLLILKVALWVRIILKSLNRLSPQAISGVLFLCHACHSVWLIWSRRTIQFRLVLSLVVSSFPCWSGRGPKPAKMYWTVTENKGEKATTGQGNNIFFAYWWYFLSCFVAVLPVGYQVLLLPMWLNIFKSIKQQLQIYRPPSLRLHPLHQSQWCSCWDTSIQEFCWVSPWLSQPSQWWLHYCWSTNMFSWFGSGQHYVVRV